MDSRGRASRNSFRLKLVKHYFYTLLFLPFALLSFSQDIYTPPKIQNAIPTLDGVIQAGEWEFAEKILLDFEVDPGNNINPKEKTIAYVSYTNTHLYIAIHAFANPKDIRASVRSRDDFGLIGDDFVLLRFDTYADGRNNYLLLANAFGSQLDARAINALTDDDRYDSSFNVDYDQYKLPKFGMIKSWYETGMDISGFIGGTASNPRIHEQDQHGLGPVILKSAVYFGLSFQVLGTGAEVNPVFLIYPKFTLWNPHNVPIAPSKYVVQVRCDVNTLITDIAANGRLYAAYNESKDFYYEGHFVHPDPSTGSYSKFQWTRSLLERNNELKEFGLEVDAYDYEADQQEVKQEYGIDLIEQIKEKYDGILLAVSHDKFSMINIESLKKDSNSIVYDLKGFLPRNIVDCRL